MDPISTYNESLISVRRRFELFADRVEVHAKWLFGGSYTNVVKLATLNPEIKKMLIRHRWRRYAGWVLALGLLLAAFLVYRAHGYMISPNKPFPREAWIGIAVAVVGGILVAMTNRKILFVRFAPQNGRGGLDIGKSGPDVERFDQFVTQVRREILRQRSR